MSDVAIRVDSLGKKYRIRHQRAGRYTALRDVISDKVRGIFRPRARPGEPPAVEDFWALKDVSFEVKRGEVIGIIGRNGAGKSTLLKLISRITEPNEGRIELVGRVASMLEVGTGFHPELTGRENIYLNGAILGMRHAEIRRRFDDIVAFSDVEKFLDTPIKRFSSGMYLRLAFAVAAHLETENLIVDEVLAVGDAEFQRKCLGKMSEAAQGGRTVLFVSHNMGAIRRLTQRCILLDRGRVKLDAPVQEAIEGYLAQAGEGLAGGIFVRETPRPPDRPFYVQRVITQRQPGGEPVNRFDCDHAFYICIEYTASRKVPGLYGYLALQRLDGTVIYEGDSRDAGSNPLEGLEAGCGTLLVKIPPRMLGPGTYQIILSFASGLDPSGPEVDDAGTVGEFGLDDTRTPRGNHRRGYLSAILSWERTDAGV
ncbi:MAG: lipopolysaccharide transport system ATP-binding protein [Alphaproteobacteria bacterium]|jgi:lipopolysaccharide transport system ATP-binding protein|nr:lipopolysaccharide transport system ATP-binding protein [Alphaproteobacteria bacterium]